MVPDGLRFVTADAQAEWTIPLPLPADATVQHLHHSELHRRLGIDQRAYTAALLDADASGRRDRGDGLYWTSVERWARETGRLNPVE